MYEGIGNGLLAMARFAAVLIISLTAIVVFLFYKNFSNKSIVTNKQIIPSVKIVTTNINGHLISDTTYIYNFKI